MTAPAIHDALGAAHEGRLPMELPPRVSPLLREQFVMPPFTVLNARDGKWQERKRWWIAEGLRSEDGRDARTFAKGAGADEVSQKILALTNGQSIFDPVLCEMAYLWFSPDGGKVLDPWAGGSARGLIAAYLGRQYVGIDLSAAQVEANIAQGDEWLARDVIDLDAYPRWVTGDSWGILYGDGPTAAGVRGDAPYDFVWSCPPYHDLEVYSDDPADLSNMSWPRFRERYRETIAGAVDLLADDRFAGIVVGEIRGADGMFRNFVGETIDAFEAAGAAYYNDMILVTSVGTLPLRVTRQMLATRKLGMTHQRVLFFVKGDPKKAADACGMPPVDAAGAVDGDG